MILVFAPSFFHQRQKENPRKTSPVQLGQVQSLEGRLEIRRQVQPLQRPVQKEDFATAEGYGNERPIWVPLQHVDLKWVSFHV